MSADSAPRALAVSPTVAAAMAGISRRVFDKLAAKHHFPTIKLGRRTVILVADLEASLKKLRDTGAAALPTFEVEVENLRKAAIASAKARKAHNT